MKKIKIIWRVIDGKAGHDKQSLALVENLKNQTKCKVFDINIQNLKNPFLAIIFKKFNLDKSLAKPDIAIGTGHKTHLYLLAIKRCFGTKIVVIMRPSLTYKLFDLCVIPKHDDVKKRNNIIFTQTSLVNFNLNIRKKDNIGLFLIGGPSRHYYWDTNFVLNQIKKISKKYKLEKFLLTTSRRTPLNFVSELNNQKIHNVKVYEYSKIEDNWLDKKISKVKKIWVTNDSYSMIMEAIVSGAHVDIINLKTKKRSKLSNEINKMKKKLSKKIPIKDEAKRVANFIVKKWF